MDKFITREARPAAPKKPQKKRRFTQTRIGELEKVVNMTKLKQVHARLKDVVETDDVEAIIACLDVLSTMFMSIEALKDSGVARTVMAVRKHSNKEAASLANQLIQTYEATVDSNMHKYLELQLHKSTKKRKRRRKQPNEFKQASLVQLAAQARQRGTKESEQQQQQQRQQQLKPKKLKKKKKTKKRQRERQHQADRSRSPAARDSSGSSAGSSPVITDYAAAPATGGGAGGGAGASSSSNATTTSAATTTHAPTHASSTLQVHAVAASSPAQPAPRRRLEPLALTPV